MLIAFALAQLISSPAHLPHHTVSPNPQRTADVLIDAPMIPLGTDILTGPTGERFPTPHFAFTQETWSQVGAVLTDQSVAWPSFPMPDGSVVDLLLERQTIAASEAGQLFVDGQPTGKLATDGVVFFQGKLAGQPGSDVFLSLSQYGTRGWMRFAPVGDESPRLVHVLAEPDTSGDWSAAQIRLVNNEALGAPTAPLCETESLKDKGTVPGTPLYETGGVQIPETTFKASAPILRELPIALETDYQLFQLFGSVEATQTYALSLFGAVSARYREQFNTVVTLPYLGLYSNANDPWVSQDQGLGSVDLLYEFQAAWSPNMPVNSAALGHFLSGAGLGGGVAWLDALCAPEFRFGVSGNINGGLPLPVVTGPLNWDFIVVAHEIGHNLSTNHTHAYCPPLDECAPSTYFGQCQSQELCINDGTIMSYCHLCSGGAANITTYFHPTVVQTISNRVDNSCLAPFRGIFTNDLGGAVIGSSGFPTAEASFDASSSSLGLDYAHSPANSIGWVVVGASAINSPTFGGLLVPSPDYLFNLSTSTPNGSLPPLSFQGLSFPAGIKLYMQLWFLDALSPSGFSATKGIEVEIVTPDPPAALTWITNPANGQEYAAIPAGPWTKARQLAQENGGNIVSIESAATEAWLKSTFLDSGMISGTLYIGMNDEYDEGTFTWSGGVPILYTNWNGGEPNDWNGYEDYSTWNGINWNDVSGTDNLPSIIQR